MFELAQPWWQLLARAAAVYLLVLVLLRLFGKRQVGQLAPLDLALLLLIGEGASNALLAALRAAGCFTPHQARYAVLETNGRIAVARKERQAHLRAHPATPGAAPRRSARAGRPPAPP